MDKTQSLSDVDIKQLQNKIETLERTVEEKEKIIRQLQRASDDSYYFFTPSLLSLSILLRCP